MLPSHGQNTAAVNVETHRAGNTIQKDKNVFNKQSEESREKKEAIKNY